MRVDDDTVVSIHYHPVVVLEVAGDVVTVDGNHPLAGLTLHFQVEIDRVREATRTELEHGHLHPE